MAASRGTKSLGADWPTVFGEPSRHMKLRRGELLFERGQPATAVFAVEEGWLRLERVLEDGSLVSVARLGAGDGVAEAALFSEIYHCDARAEVASRVAVFDKSAVLARLDGNALAQERLLRHLAGQVRRLRALLELRGLRRAEDRILAYLDLLEALDEPWREDQPARAMAHDVGLTPEAFYRAMTRLEEKKRVVRDGRLVRHRRSGKD